MRAFPSARRGATVLGPGAPSRCRDRVPRGGLGGGQKIDRSAKITFARHGKNTAGQGAVLGRMEGDIAEEGMDRGETNIAAAGGVAATLLEMIEEPSNERGVQICQGQL